MDINKNRKLFKGEKIKYTRMKEKRGISPVVATVLLVAIVVVVGIIIFLWASGIFGESEQKFGEAITKSCDTIAISASYSGGSLQVSNDDSRIPLYGLIVYDEQDGNLVPIDAGEVGLAPGESKEISLSLTDPKQVSPVLKGTKDGSDITYTCDKRKIDISS